MIKATKSHDGIGLSQERAVTLNKISYDIGEWAVMRESGEWGGSINGG